MADEVLEQREVAVADYLKLFDSASADYAYVASRSERLQSIVVKKLRTPSGQIFEETTFVEKSGVTYAVRARLEG
jgi:hypothetical protein